MTLLASQIAVWLVISALFGFAIGWLARGGDSVEHRDNSDLEWTPAPPENFTGRAWFGLLAPRPTPEALNVLGVLFEPGARTDWHWHPGGQTLYVVSGAGKVQTADGETVVFGPGDVVYAPPDQVHWHGATPTSYMMHLSLTTGDATRWRDEKVSDANYLA